MYGNKHTYTCSCILCCGLIYFLFKNLQNQFDCYFPLFHSYDNEYETKESENQPGFENFKHMVKFKPHVQCTLFVS